MINYLKNWDFLRVVRLALGLLILVQAIQARDWMFALVGLAFTLMPVLNIGCCSTAGCGTPSYKNKKESEEISFEEIK